MTEKSKIADLKSRVMAHTCQISLCLSSIGNSSLGRIEAQLKQALENREADDDTTLAPNMLPSTITPPLEDDEVVIDSISRKFTGLTIVPDLGRTEGALPEATSSAIDDDLSEMSLSASPNRSRNYNLRKPSRGPAAAIDRVHRAFPPSPKASDDGFPNSKQRALEEAQDPRLRKPSATMSLSSSDTQTVDREPDVKDVVKAAMKELAQIRQKERMTQPLKVKAQPANQKPSDALKDELRSQADDEINYRKLNTKDWLTVGTWWLLKARFWMGELDRGGRATKSSIRGASIRGSIRRASSIADDQSIVAGFRSQAYLDLLKASWILYDVILKDDYTQALQSTENRKSFYDLQEGIHHTMRSFRNIDLPEPDDLLDSDLDSNIFEHQQPKEEMYEDDVDILDNIQNSRWIAVHNGDAGHKGETVVYRAFVDAGVGVRSQRVQSSNAAYLLMLSTQDGESEPKITLCNQSGSLAATRDFTTDDLEDFLRAYDENELDSEPIALEWGDLEVVVRFTDNEELNRFMQIPKNYFKAVQRREPRVLPRANETLIFKASVASADELRVASMQPIDRRHQFKSCDLRILETTSNAGWRTTRRLVLSSSAAEPKPWCKEYFFPMSRVQITKETPRHITVKWSDCNHEDYTQTDGQYNKIYTHRYDDTKPNNAFNFSFLTEAAAKEFRAVVLSLSPQPLHSWTDGLQLGHIYEITDQEPATKYKAILTVKKTFDWEYSEIYFIYRDTDFKLTPDGHQVLFPEVRYVDYISTHHKELFEPDKPVHFSHCEKKVNQLSVSFTSQELALSLLSALTAYANVNAKLIFARRANHFTTKAPTFGKTSSKKGHADILLWRTGTRECRLLSRWGDHVEDKWVSFAVHNVDHAMGSNRVTFHNTEYERGRNIDMANIIARNSRDTERRDQRRVGTITVAFETVKGTSFPAFFFQCC